MTLRDWITLGIAIWGALLSTILAIYQLFKDRRKIVLGTEIGSDQSLYLTAVNVSHRPITLAGVSIFRYIGDGKNAYWDSFEDFVMYAMINEADVFPKTLAEGEHYKLELGERVYEAIREDSVRKIKYMAWDVEGRRYTRVENRDPIKPVPKLMS